MAEFETHKNRKNLEIDLPFDPLRNTGYVGEFARGWEPREAPPNVPSGKRSFWHAQYPREGSPCSNPVPKGGCATICNNLQQKTWEVSGCPMFEIALHGAAHMISATNFDSVKCKQRKVLGRKTGTS